ncbi:MAG: hypothetical protein ACR2QO_20900 [Acidimicrobiales bacterium]
MRRGLASLIMGLSLLVATASWAGFVLSRTVLDPGRSEALADTLLEDPEVRATIVDRLADSAESQIPTDVPVTRDVVDAAAENALEDPRVEALIRDGLVQAHQNALNGIDEPVMLDGAALGAAGRDAVVAQQPDLDPFLPQAPTLEVELPSTGLSWLGTVKSYVDRYTLFGAIVAIAGVSAAFVLARRRAAALRRVAFWAVSASAFWIAAAYALPWVLERIAPSSVSIASAAVDVFFGAMIRPALTLAGVGVGLLLLSFFWPAIERRRPAAMLDQAATAAESRGGQSDWTPIASPASVSGQPSIDLRRAAPPHPHAQQPAPGGAAASGWTPAASPPAAWQVPSQPAHYEERGGYGAAVPNPAGVDATKPFPQIWSNADREVPSAQPGAFDPAATRLDQQPRQAPPAPPASAPATASARPAVPRTQQSIDADAATQIAGLASAPAAPQPSPQPPGLAADPAPATQIRGGAAAEAADPPLAPPTVASPSIPVDPKPGPGPGPGAGLGSASGLAAGPGSFANATQVARPADLAASRPPGAPAPRQTPPSAPAFDIDPDAAADADDFGAEWVEGAGYVDGD